MPAQVVPLTSAPVQTFTLSLNIDGGITVLQITLRFAYMAQYWWMTINDQNGNPLLDSLPCVTGDWPAANILSQHAYLNIGSAQLINASSYPLDYPGISSLGSSFLLIWDDTPTS
jgi:hypothetical protein